MKKKQIAIDKSLLEQRRRRAKRAEEIIKAQGVKPIWDVDELMAQWAMDDDPDELLASVLDEGKKPDS